MKTAIIGGGLAGVTAAWQMQQLGAAFVLYEASGRLGGTVETVRRDGFVVETGPDGWISEKPWAAELARELGLGDELIYSQDATRVTYILSPAGELVAIPDGMRMMVPTDLQALEESPLFSAEAVAAYASETHRAGELRISAPVGDESVAHFVGRHFGPEVLAKIGAPLLSGVFGGEVETLSVRAVMPAFVAMEREFGSLILGLQAAARKTTAVPLFTTLREGTQGLVDGMEAALPVACVRRGAAVRSLVQRAGGWLVDGDFYERVVLAVPAHVAGPLLAGVSARAGELLRLADSSAIIVAFAFAEKFALPQGFGFLAPAGTSALLAGTFVDQKYPDRVPSGGRLLRAFFGGKGERADDPRGVGELTSVALGELRRILGDLPEPVMTVVRHWPRSLPQYAVGHLERMAELDGIVAGLEGLDLIGNAYKGVGLPDLVREARRVGRAIAG